MCSTPVEADHVVGHVHHREVVAAAGDAAAAVVAAPEPADTGAVPEPVAAGTAEVAVVAVDSVAAVAGMAGADCTVAGVVDTVAEVVVDNGRDLLRGQPADRVPPLQTASRLTQAVS